MTSINETPPYINRSPRGAARVEAHGEFKAHISVNLVHVGGTLISEFNDFEEAFLV